MHNFILFSLGWVHLIWLQIIFYRCLSNLSIEWTPGLIQQVLRGNLQHANSTQWVSDCEIFLKRQKRLNQTRLHTLPLVVSLWMCACRTCTESRNQNDTTVSHIHSGFFIFTKNKSCSPGYNSDHGFKHNLSTKTHQASMCIWHLPTGFQYIHLWICA